MTWIVRAHNVVHRRGGQTILNGVDLELEQGTATALVGPSGSGKSTLLALLAGLGSPDEGSVERAAQPRETGLILQSYGLVRLLTAAENVEVALQPGTGEPLAREEVRTRALDALAEVSLLPVADHLVEELSGGQQQRVAIARALSVQPRLLIADEITAELDPALRETVVDLVLSTVQSGSTTLIATHDLALAHRCDRILRLVNGNLFASAALQ